MRQIWRREEQFFYTIVDAHSFVGSKVRGITYSDGATYRSGGMKFHCHQHFGVKHHYIYTHVRCGVVQDLYV